MTQMELAALIGVEQSHVSHLEQGLREPSQETLQNIAIETNFSVPFFGQAGGPEFPLGSLLYRRRATLASADRDRLR